MPGGESIGAWIECGSESPFWSQHNRSIGQQLRNAKVDRLDLIIWLQGEADSDKRTPPSDPVTGVEITGRYNSFFAYKKAMVKLLSQCKSLPQFRPHSLFVAEGLGRWQCEFNARNDVLLNMESLFNDPQVKSTLLAGPRVNPKEASD